MSILKDLDPNHTKIQSVSNRRWVYYLLIVLIGVTVLATWLNSDREATAKPPQENPAALNVTSATDTPTEAPPGKAEDTPVREQAALVVETVPTGTEAVLPTDTVPAERTAKTSEDRPVIVSSSDAGTGQKKMASGTPAKNDKPKRKTTSARAASGESKSQTAESADQDVAIIRALVR